MNFSQLVTTLILIAFLSACGAESPADSANTPAVPSQKITYFENTVVSLTFDDGNDDNYRTRFILKQNNLRATFYVVSGFTGKAGYMNLNQLRNLYADGNEIGGHTFSHINLTTLSGAELKTQVCRDREKLLGFGFDVISFAYPFGHYDDEAQQVVIECGYSNARAVSSGPASIPPANMYAIPAMPYMVKDTDFAKMTRYVTSVEEQGGGWAIFVFHHVCDDCDQYAVSIETFLQFAQWLGAQQEKGLVVKTVGEVIGGDVEPAVSP